ncbi:rCG62187, partial [Rattus norvegicus]
MLPPFNTNHLMLLIFLKPRTLEEFLPSGPLIFVSRLASFPTHQKHQRMKLSVEGYGQTGHKFTGHLIDGKKGQDGPSLVSLSSLTTKEKI